MARGDTVELELFVHHKTAQAVKISVDEDEDTAIWIPLAVIREPVDRSEIVRDTHCMITVYENFALEKGLI